MNGKQHQFSVVRDPGCEMDDLMYELVGVLGGHTMNVGVSALTNLIYVAFRSSADNDAEFNTMCDALGAAMKQRRAAENPTKQ